MTAILLAIRGFLSSIPWQVWAAAAFVALLPMSYCKGKSDGKQVIIERLEKAQAEAEVAAEKAANSADKKQQERAKEFEATQDALKTEIENAKATDSNPLDAIFGGVPTAD